MATRQSLFFINFCKQLNTIVQDRCKDRVISMIRMGYSTVSNIDQTYIPRRTVMYVPGHDPKKLKKIPNLGVDCAVLECEDGVAINMKVGNKQT